MKHLWKVPYNLYRGPSIDASYQVSYHLAKWLQRKSCFRNRPIRNKNCLWWPCLLTDQNERWVFDCDALNFNCCCL
jgi:hypothetical protein